MSVVHLPTRPSRACQRAAPGELLELAPTAEDRAREARIEAHLAAAVDATDAADRRRHIDDFYAEIRARSPAMRAWLERLDRARLRRLQEGLA